MNAQVAMALARDRQIGDMDAEELAEWLECLDDVALRHGDQATRQLLHALHDRARRWGIQPPQSTRTPYINTIPRDQQPPYPGDTALEQRISSLIRWNAMAMVVRANRQHTGIGGHISTYASAATLFEVGFHHFFHARTADHPGDFVYFQGHASPGVYARAFLEGRLSADQLERFRREAPREKGLSSYPHPWLMPGFWQFPTVSMGLAPIMAIYQARFLNYLHHRGIADTSPSRVWAFVGDGEMDEPESVGALTLAAREQLDNLTLVVNCNLQRLDGPVRGNGKIIQELEGLFRGAGWNVIKVIWGSDWDPLLAADDGQLVQRMNETVDGQYQKYTVASGAFIRKDFFGTSPALKALVEDLSDAQLQRLNRGGHDPHKVYAAYRAAVEHEGRPTVILAKTIKGYGLGEAGEGRNITHKQKQLNEQELLSFRARFEVPLDDEAVADAPFFRPDDESDEIKYLQDRRAVLGGYLPSRVNEAPSLEIPPLEHFAFALKGSDQRTASTTMSFDRLLNALIKDEHIGSRVVPIIPDEARTFGLETLFGRCGIYAPGGQQYDPVDAEKLIHYKEASDGQLLEEGITEAGAMSSFIAAGTAYSSLSTPLIPCYLFYSMFGFQRVGDLIWAAADARAKGFLLGCTAGRTTLNGEGLQHQDGHSPLVATTIPTLQSYDPAYAYEVAVIIQDGLRRMFQQGETLLYYLTLYNQSYTMPAMPDDVADGILQGMYLINSLELDQEGSAARPQLFGSGTMLPEVLSAQRLLADEFDVASDVWSVTSYCQLRRQARAADRQKRLSEDEKGDSSSSYLHQSLEGRGGPFVAATDYVSLVPDQIAPWIPGRYVTLGTDGFGRSDTKPVLREHFEVNAAHIAWATLTALAADGQFDPARLRAARKALQIDPDKLNPAMA